MILPIICGLALCFIGAYGFRWYTSDGYMTFRWVYFFAVFGAGVASLVVTLYLEFFT